MTQKALHNYRARVPAKRTATEIVDLLAAQGATDISLQYLQGEVQAISWSVETRHGFLSYRLPIDVEATSRALYEDGVLRTADASRREQAARTAWRTVKDWAEAQMALVRTGQARLEQVFLPYMLMPDGRTLYERLEGRGFQDALPPGSGGR